LAARDGVRGGLYQVGDDLIVELSNANRFDVQVEYTVEPRISVQPGTPIRGRALIQAGYFWTEGPQRKHRVDFEQPSLVIRSVTKVELEVSESYTTDAEGRQSQTKTYKIKNPKGTRNR